MVGKQCWCQLDLNWTGKLLNEDQTLSGSRKEHKRSQARIIYFVIPTHLIFYHIPKITAQTYTLSYIDVGRVMGRYLTYLGTTYKKKAPDSVRIGRLST